MYFSSKPVNNKEDHPIKKVVFVTSLLLFLVSLTQQCYCTTADCGDSIMAFLLGWAALLSGGAGIAWLANPLLIASWILLRKNLKATMFLSVGAVLFSLSFLLFDSVIANEAGHKQIIISYKTGFWLWVSSSMIMLVGTFYLMFRHNTRAARKQ